MNDEIGKIKKDLSDGLITEKQAELQIESLSADKNGRKSTSANFTKVAVLLAAGIIIFSGILFIMSKKETSNIVTDDKQTTDISPVNKSTEQNDSVKSDTAVDRNPDSEIQGEKKEPLQAAGKINTDYRMQKNSVSNNTGEISGNKDINEINKGAAQNFQGISAKLKVASPEIVSGGAQGGPRSKGAITRVVMRNIASLRYAYNKRLALNPSLKGRIDTKFSIDGNGDVVHCIITSSTLNDRELESLIVSKIKTWKFDKMEDEKDTTEVVYPFLFDQ